MTELQPNEWKDIPGYEGHYQAHPSGQIRSVDKMVNARNGKRKKAGKVLNPGITWKGYERVSLSMNCKAKNHSVHKLILKTFTENPLNKPEVNHINGIKTDNRLENLEWCTPSENAIHSYGIGLHTRQKLTVDKVDDIRKSQLSTKELSNQYGVTKRTIQQVKKRVTWKS